MQWLSQKRFYEASLTITALVGVAVFVWLASAPPAGVLQEINERTLTWIHDHDSSLLEALAQTLSEIGRREGVGVIAGAVALSFLVRRRKMDAVWLALAYGGAIGLVLQLKDIFQRPRPDLFEPLASAKGYGFPSGHALLSVCVFSFLATLLVENPARGRGRFYDATALLLLTLGIIWSRLYLQVHWPTDVAGSVAVGIAWTSLCLLARRVVNAWRKS